MIRGVLILGVGVGIGYAAAMRKAPVIEEAIAAFKTAMEELTKIVEEKTSDQKATSDEETVTPPSEKKPVFNSDDPIIESIRDNSTEGETHG